MRYNYLNRYLVVIDGDVNVYKYDNYKFDPLFLSFKPKHIFIGKSKVCDKTEFLGLLMMILISRVLLFYLKLKIENTFIFQVWKLPNLKLETKL